MLSYFLFEKVGSTIGRISTLPTGVTGVSGWTAGATDNSAGGWLISSGAVFLCHIPSSGPQNGVGYALPSGKVWTGVSVIGSEPYCIASDGTLQTVVGSALTPVTGSFGQLSRGLANDGTNLYTTLPAAAAMGILALSGAASGTTSTVSTPMSVPSCIAANASGVAVGGWSAASLPSGSTALAGDPALPTSVAAAVQAGANHVLLLTGSEPAWSITQTATGTGAPSALAWTPNGEQILVADPTNGKLQVWNYSLGSLSASQTLTATNATQVAVTPDSLQSLVAEPSANAVQVFLNTSNTWASSQTIGSLSSASSVLALSTVSAVVGYSGAIAWYGFGTTWTLSKAVTGLGFTPAALATDGAGTIFAVGSSGGNGYLAAVTQSGIVASTSWTGSAMSVVWTTGQIFVLDGSSNLVRCYGLYNTLLHWLGSTNAPSGRVAFGTTYDSVFLCGTTTTPQYRVLTPWVLTAANYGQVGVYAGGSWNTATLSTGERPSALTFDASGNVWAATIEGNLYEISTAGSILSTTTIAMYGSQPVGTPLGISSLAWVGGHLYAGASLCPAIIELQ